MINSITRHAAQAIWHDAMQAGTYACGILLSKEACIVAGIACLPEQPLVEFLCQTSKASSSRLCGWFYTTLPSVDQMIKKDQALMCLGHAMRTPDCIHIHLDSDAKGLLKMAAYTLQDKHLSNINLTMAMH